MGAVVNQQPAQYRVQAYKKLMDGSGNSVPCNRDVADEWWVDQLVGPNRWAQYEQRESENSALLRLADLNGGPTRIEKTHYGYSAPRR